jgi:hypothetical protein
VVGGVAELADELGVRCIAVVGDADPIDAPIPVVSLTERFGSDRALDDASGCLEALAPELPELGGLGAGGAP